MANIEQLLQPFNITYCGDIWLYRKYQITQKTHLNVIETKLKQAYFDPGR